MPCLDQLRESRGRDLHMILASCGIRNRKGTCCETLAEEAESVGIPGQNLQESAPAIQKDEESAALRIFAQHLTYSACEP